MEKKEFIVDSNIMLEKFLQDKGIDFGVIKMSLRHKDIKVNSIRVRKNIPLQRADNVEIFFKNRPVDKTLDVDRIFEDDNILIIDKPAGIESSGAGGIDERLCVTSVHRLDRNTQGLVIFAKTEEAREVLLDAMRQRTIAKKYVCEVYGDTSFDGEIYTAYLFKDAKKSLVYISSTMKPKYKEIKTRFRTIKHGGTSLVDCELLTGRTHQIRAHLAHLGHFIIGDNKYGDKRINEHFKEKWQKLYCYSLSFPQFSEECMKGVSGKTFTKYPKEVEKWIN